MMKKKKKMMKMIKKKINKTIEIIFLIQLFLYSNI